MLMIAAPRAELDPSRVDLFVVDEHVLIRGKVVAIDGGVGLR
jgi:hypothetical protein